MQRGLTRGFQDCAVSWTHGHWNNAGGAGVTAPRTCGLIGHPSTSAITGLAHDGLGYGRWRIRQTLAQHPSVARVARRVRDRLRDSARRWRRRPAWSNKP